MYTKEEDVIHFVFIAFKGMKRKKEDIDLSFHSIMVGNMLKNAGCSEDTVCIGYLHDIIEDTKYTYNDILKRYGKKIADSVMALSDDKSISNYVKRKSVFIQSLKDVDDDILTVELADKLQNLISDYDIYLKFGKKSLATEFDNYEQLKWYHSELKKLFNSRKLNSKLLERYNQIYEEYFPSLSVEKKIKIKKFGALSNSDNRH